MKEYIEREALMRQIKEIHCAECNSYHGVRCRACWVDDTFGYIESEPSADVAQVRHGRWIEHEETPDDAYRHHKCSECNVNAPFDYNMREDWDEGMDGEWDLLGLVDDGINEHLTDYCPNCGAKMDLEG